jgi:hypothetical protein
MYALAGVCGLSQFWRTGTSATTVVCDEMAAEPVSTHVNNVRNIDEQCIEPFEDREVCSSHIGQQKLPCREQPVICRAKAERTQM